MTIVEKMPNEMWRETSVPRRPKTAVVDEADETEADAVSSA